MLCNYKKQKKILNTEYGPMVDDNTLKGWKEEQIDIDNIQFLTSERDIQKEYIKWGQEII